MFKFIKVWTKSKNEKAPVTGAISQPSLMGSPSAMSSSGLEDGREGNIVGREGALIIRDGNLLVFASNEVVFRCPVESLAAWRLLSGDGVVLTGPDIEHGGGERSLIVHFTKY